jgi:exosome complex component RRP41
MRPYKLEVGVLPQADGSAMIHFGNNKIMVGVYGPREIHPKHLSLSDKLRVRAEYRLATFSVNERKSPAPRRREHELSKMIQEALEPSIFTEKFPRSVIDLYILVLDADGGTRAASITAASLALADSGLPLRGLVSSVAAGKVGGKIVLDLSDEEDKYGEGDMPLAMINQNQEITLLQADGQFSVDEVKEAIEMAMKGCQELHKAQEEVLKSKYQEIASQFAELEEESEESEVSEESDSEDEESNNDDLDEDIEDDLDDEED